ncbi:MAG TPA: Glu-tRNA(Gln) amidotransferase subunit GatE [Candidatus Thermoplasmatota archaeon]|nr:Glu-tRNA(Gln) amidotransferase subunit GatE [Candidatus Thermoplasmatota archaeon]
MNGNDALHHLQAKQLDYAAIGFRCGLEIHQQLDTRKLFSPCPSEVVDAEQLARRTQAYVDRRLRATGGEMGGVDVAAAAETRKQRTFRYLVLSGVTSLVELDEEPPHPMGEDALDVTLTFAGLARSRPVAEVQVMRKTVVDGSNTSGFQRTALVATGGRLQVEGGDVGIWTVAVEEDSARKLDDVPPELKALEKPGVVLYTLDRLGIPLIEVATAPDIRDPAHAQRTAARIGALLRATGRVKRGLGTIRQDLNVSVAVGERVEIKGAQDLRSIPKVIDLECRRQLWMHHVALQLRARGFDPGRVGSPQDATAAFAASQSKAVADGVKRGQRVLALALPGMAGLLKGLDKDAPRLGRELADHAKAAAGVKGIFHSDELPAYGITQPEVDAVRELLQVADGDAFALCIESEAVARRALEAVAERARRAAGPPAKEVRAAQPDGSTRFQRPMPGAARMYPETDVPPTIVTRERWQRILAHLPPTPEERVQAFVRTHGISQDLAQQLLREGAESDFEPLVAAGADPALAARILLQLAPTWKDAARVQRAVPGVLAALKAGRFAKEAVPDVLAALDADPALTVEAAVERLGVAPADTQAVDEVCARVVQSRLAFVRERGEAAVGPLMGLVMAELRGKADGKLIAERLKAAVASAK